MNLKLVSLFILFFISGPVFAYTAITAQEMSDKISRNEDDPKEYYLHCSAQNFSLQFPFLGISPSLSSVDVVEFQYRVYFKKGLLSGYQGTIDVVAVPVFKYIDKGDKVYVRVGDENNVSATDVSLGGGIVKGKEVIRFSQKVFFNGYLHSMDLYNLGSKLEIIIGDGAYEDGSDIKATAQCSITKAPVFNQK